MSDTELKFKKFHDLMPHRVREVLVVSSPYEAFILEQDGILTERLFTEYSELNISFAPRVTHVPTGEEALRALESRRFDLVIVMYRLTDIDPFDLGRRIKQMRSGKPVILLALDAAELRLIPSPLDPHAIDKVFLWTGDVKILLAIIKYIEDRDNVEHDIRTADLQVVILVEDSVRYYSSYFAILYSELMSQSHSLIAEGLNDLHRTMRLRARPKILLASTFEEAMALFERYHNNVLALVTDVRFPMEGKLRSDAGRHLVRRVRAQDPLLPILIQSAEEENAAFAREMDCYFFNKRSPSLLLDLREFLQDHLGFGDFVFRLPDGSEVARARDLHEFERLLPEVPAESLENHAGKNQISIWLMARCEFKLARLIRPQTVSDFGSIEDMRHYLMIALAEIRLETGAGVVTDFSAEDYDPGTRYLRLYPGSLGGKARGIAFINSLLPLPENRRRFREMLVEVPTSMVIGTDAFDRFLDENQLREFAVHCDVDEDIAQRFTAAALPQDLLETLRFLLSRVRYPLAVRSSSLLEDSQFQPFAGIYATYMLPNSADSLEQRLADLRLAVKLVYASTFFENAKSYVAATPHRIEEEKMAVILQRMVGSTHGTRFYPTIAGVAESYNFYPIGHQRPDDGIALAALGLGRVVMEGGQALRFSPAHPQVLPQFSSPREVLRNSQSEFWALDLTRTPSPLRQGQEATLLRCHLADAEADGTLEAVGSVYSPADNIIRDSLDQPGPRVITFNNILKHNMVPLAPTLAGVVDLARRGMGGPVEVEFAVDLAESPTLYFLQMRPLVSWAAFGGESIDTNGFTGDQIMCRSTQALGFGRVQGLRDVVYVQPQRFDRSRTLEIAREVGEYNHRLSAQKRPYILVGQGRWGSAQHSLGIPVQWAQIAGAKVIVEVYPQGFHVEPSQGTHFFQNITSLRIGYITVEERDGQDAIDWDWLAAQPSVSEGRFLRHIRFDDSLVAHLDATRGRAVITKPGIAAGPAEDDDH